jgi:hypothetical protein
MAAPDERLFQRWGHSFEEDHEGVAVYRPAGYGFPRARGRDAIEFRADGSYVDWAIGPGDARQPRAGTWELGDDGRLLITTAAGERRAVEVVQLAPDRLELRTQGGS